MSFPQKRELIAGRWVIDNGDQAPLLDSCPCCGKPFNEPAADAVLQALTEGRMTFGQALEGAQILRRDQRLGN